MSTSETILFPAEFDQLIPSRADVIDVLLSGGFLKLCDSSHWKHELAWEFMSESDRDIYRRNSDVGVAYPGYGVAIEVSSKPKMKVSSNIQYIKGLTSPDGNTWGDLQTAYGYLASYDDNPVATATDPISGSIFRIADLDFDHAVGFGRLFISIRRARAKEECCRLLSISDILGFPVRSCTNYG